MSAKYTELYPGAWQVTSCYPPGYWEAIGKRDAENLLQEVREERERRTGQSSDHSGWKEIRLA